jgi:membrane protease YdiL (CAAX protease family)
MGRGAVIDRHAEPRARLGWAAARRHPVLAFFLLAYAFSWLAELLLFTVLRLPAALVVPVVTVGPTFAALVMTGAIEGRPGIRRLVARLRLWRVGRRWYFVALIAIPLALLAGSLVQPGVLASFTPTSPVRWVIEWIVVLTIGAVIGGPLLEEPGWRGFALPRLQSQLGPLGATLLLGVVWAGWHFPQFLMPEWADQNGGLQASSVVIFVLTVMSIAVILTWLFNHTQGSLFLAIVAHSGVNTSQAMFNQLFPGAGNSDLNGLIGFGVVALVLLLATRGRLGCPTPARERPASLAMSPART